MIPRRFPRCRCRFRCATFAGAFTCSEALAILAALSLLVAVVLPALATDQARSLRVVCANNLRQLGVGFQIWGNDHNDTLPQEVPVSEGGTKRHLLSANVWFHLAWISNEVSSPKIYLCPSDTGKPASDFSGTPDVGYLHSNSRNAASSYLLSYTGPLSLNQPGQIVAGDRNVATRGGVVGCSRFATALEVLRGPPAGIAQWTAGLHGAVGNALASGGQVLQLDRDGLNHSLEGIEGDNGVKHIIVPR